METPEREPEFYTVAEVASLLRVTPMTVYRLINTHKLTAIQVGRSYRVSVAEVRRIKLGGTS